MNLKTSQSRSEQGTIMVVCLLTAIIVGFILGSYLLLVETQHLSVARAQAWNAGVAVAEAGVEEALAQLNAGGARFYTQTNFVTNGWTQSGSFIKAPRRFLGSNYYDVCILISSTPVVYSTGYTMVPITRKYLSRTVRVQTAITSVAQSPMLAMTNIYLNGSGINSDSYISTNPNYSTNGDYDPAKARDHGDLATDSNSTDKNKPAIALGNGKVKGHVRTGPTGIVTMNGASVGDVSWVNGGNLGIEPGWRANDVNIAVPDVPVPYTSGLLMPLPGISPAPDYTFVAGDYYLSSLKLNGTSKTNIAIVGNVRIYVTGDVTVAGAINILPGGSLTLYVGGTDKSTPHSAALSSVYVDHAWNFKYFGLPNNTSFTYNGGSNFKGAIYAPSAAMKLGGGGSGGTTDYDFSGTYVIYSAEMNGHFSFHFDEALLPSMLVFGYVATSWQEL